MVGRLSGVNPLAFRLDGEKNLAKDLLGKGSIVNPVIRQGRYWLFGVSPEHPVHTIEKS